MPVYDYECQKCGIVIEMEHGFKEEPPRKMCPECRCKLKKVFSPVGIVFKGEGFYINDSKSKDKSHIGATEKECVSGNGKSKKEDSSKKSTESSDCASCGKAESCEKTPAASDKK